ncbi:MAG: hypothetical protein AABZ53_09815 [Planctomycetota bacterium]
MISPAPTTRLAPYLTRGVLAQNVAATATKPAHIVLEILNTSYQIHLLPGGPVTTPVGKRIVGVVRADARRVDIVKSGGRFLEPVAGRPRRVQGTVVGRDASANTITVNAGVPIVLKLTDARQRADQFEDGAFVSCDVCDGATFTPQA